MKKLLYKIKPPCKECPYTLGLVNTLVNPCPECKKNGYETYKRFKEKTLISNENEAEKKT